MLLRQIGLAQEVVESSLEIRGRRVVPRRELELGSLEPKDRAEREEWLFFGEHRGDDAATGETEGSDPISHSQLQLAGLLRLSEHLQDGPQGEVLDISAKRHRSAI